MLELSLEIEKSQFRSCLMIPDIEHFKHDQSDNTLTESRGTTKQKSYIMRILFSSIIILTSCIFLILKFRWWFTNKCCRCRNRLVSFWRFSWKNMTIWNFEFFLSCASNLGWPHSAANSSCTLGCTHAKVPASVSQCFSRTEVKRFK